MRQHNVWCVCVAFCVERYVGLPVQHTSPHRTPSTHTKRYAAASPQLTFYIFLEKFKFIDFNKEPMSSLKMIWITIETCWGVLKCFNILD